MEDEMGCAYGMWDVTAMADAIAFTRGCAQGSEDCWTSAGAKGKFPRRSQVVNVVGYRSGGGDDGSGG
jgi:hypothetical protein